MNWIDMLNSPSVFGLPSSVVAGAVAGAVSLAAAAGFKTWQDRDMFRPSVAIARELRREARDQRRALGANRVGRGVPAGGQFAAKQYDDAGVELDR